MVSGRKSPSAHDRSGHKRRVRPDRTSHNSSVAGSRLRGECSTISPARRGGLDHLPVRRRPTGLLVDRRSQSFAGFARRCWDRHHGRQIPLARHLGAVSISGADRGRDRYGPTPAPGPPSEPISAPAPIGGTVSLLPSPVSANLCPYPRGRPHRRCRTALAVRHPASTVPATARFSFPRSAVVRRPASRQCHNT